jgi:hypothetical protein
MAKDLLRELSSSTAQLLFAGASAARPEQELRKLTHELSVLSQSAPAVSRVVEQLQRVTTATAPHFAREVLTLSEQCSKIESALAQEANVLGELQSFAKREPLLTPLNSEQLEAVQEAMAGGAPAGAELLQRAISQGWIVDLRLLNKLDSLLHSHLDDELVERIFVLYGPPAAELLMKQFDPKGKFDDAQRLRFYAAIVGPAAVPELKRAFAEGSALVRASALEQLFRVAPSEGAAASLAQGITDAAEDVAIEAIEILVQLAGDDRALESLISALNRADICRVAAQALGRLTHPAKTAALLAAWESRLRQIPRSDDATAPARRKAKSSRKSRSSTPLAPPSVGSTAAIAPDEQSDLIQSARAAILALGAQRDATADALLFDLWTTSANDEIRCCCGEELVRTRDPEVRRALLTSLNAATERERAIAIKTITHYPEDAVALAAPHFDTSVLQDAHAAENAEAILDSIVEQASEFSGDGQPVIHGLDAAWEPFLLSVLLHSRYSLVYTACELLSALRSERAVDVLVERLKTAENPTEIVSQLEVLRSPRSVPAIVSLMDNSKVMETATYAIASALRAIDSVEAIEPIRGYLSRLASEHSGAKSADAAGKRRRTKKIDRSWELNELRDVLKYLERVRPRENL